VILAGATALFRSQSRASDDPVPTLGASSSAPAVVTTTAPPPPAPTEALVRQVGVVPASVESKREPAPSSALPGPGAVPGESDTTPGETLSRTLRSVPRPAPVRYQVLVRPYGSLQVDDERKSSEALSVHTLALTPGRHVLRVSCQWCEDQVVPIDVVAGKPETLAIPARLKPAELRFAFEPSSAQVRVGEVSRAAADSLAHPFEIASPRAPTRFVHRVEYDVTAPGYRPVHSSVEILPGATRTLTGRLVPE
jgi:serine/threonine-protein kinase